MCAKGNIYQKIFDPAGISIAPPDMPDAPVAEKPADTTAADSAMAAEAAAEQRRKRQTAKGRRSTILTGGQGDMSAVPATRKTALGQ